MMINITADVQLNPTRRIRLTPLNLEAFDAARKTVNAPAFKRKVTPRDQNILVFLRQLHALSVDQIQRLFWPDAAYNTAYRRLSLLIGYGLLAQARNPDPTRLPVKRAFALGLNGWAWLQEPPSQPHLLRHTRADLVLRDLLAAEVVVKLIEAFRPQTFSLSWFGDETSAFDHPQTHSPLVAANGLGLLYTAPNNQRADWSCLLELDAGVHKNIRSGKEWTVLIRGYEELRILSKSLPVLKQSLRPPVVLLITQNNAHTLKLARWLSKYQKQPLFFCLASWNQLNAAHNILTDPIWLIGNPAENNANWPTQQRPLTATMIPALRAAITT